MTEPTIICPKCKTSIKLTESLAAPLIEATRRKFEKELSQKDEEIAEREEVLSEEKKKLAKEKRALAQEVADQVDEQLKSERIKIAQAEERKAKRTFSAELQNKDKELSDLQEFIEKQNKKITEAQNAKAEYIRKERELNTAKSELELTVQQRVTAGIAKAQTETERIVEERYKLKIAENDHTMAGLRAQIEDLKQRAEQGSQQLQGEVQEVDLENLLRAEFPIDIIEPVPKGQAGADKLQRVLTNGGVVCGTIIWESKRTKNWGKEWITKLKDDQRAVKAEIPVIVSRALPDEIESFGMVEGVWVTDYRLALPLATALRRTLLEVNMARSVSEGQLTKQGEIYEYLTGPKFKHRVEAIVETFIAMKDDLDAEKRAITKLWAKRETQIVRVLNATSGMHGDLQGIAGKSIQQIEGLDLKSLAAGESDI